MGSICCILCGGTGWPTYPRGISPYRKQAVRYVANSFSLGMVPSERGFAVNVFPVSGETASRIAGEDRPESAVGHIDTARIFEQVLGVPVPANRISLSLGSGDTILVGQYAGPRLPEGATALPEGAVIKWYLVTVVVG